MRVAGACALALTLAAASLQAAQPLVPVAVPFASGPAFPQGRVNGRTPDPQYSAAAAIDGNPGTFCCLLDDTLTGTSASSIPARAAAPVTGHMVFDLGRPYAVLGIRLTGRKDAGGLNPREADFFFYADDNPAAHRVADDLEGDRGIRPLATRVTLPPLAGGRSESIFWDGVVARYIGLRVNSSYESGPVHFNFQLAEVACHVSPAPAGSAPGTRLPPLYVKRDSLAETLLTCRERYAAIWLARSGRADGPARESQPTGSARESPPTTIETGAEAAADRLWEQIRRDFPAAQHRLLDYVPHEWFASNGWLAQADNVAFERRLIEAVLRDGGETARHLRRAFEELTRGNPSPHPLPKGEGAAAEAVPATVAGVAPPQDRRWLELCAATAEFALRLKEIRSLRAAVDDLAGSFGSRYDGERYRRRIARLTERLAAEYGRHLPGSKPAAHTECAGYSAADVSLADELAQLQRDALVLGNPLLAPGKLLFVKRYTYSPGWYYAEFMRASRFGGNLCVLSLADGRVTELVPQLAGGIFDRCDLSFDGRRIVFAYKAAPGRGFRLWEVGVDGTGLRQLTVDPPDEPQRIEKYWHPQMKASGVYRHHTDDFHPCYLPDGGIAFASTRCERGVLCDQGDSLAVNTLYRMNGDSSGLQPLSEGALSESTPAVMNDGRILYTRWEYVDKGVIAVQSLWAMHPDGTQTTEVYGNDIELPPVLIHGRQIPGCEHLFVCTCTMHHPFAVGPIALIDTRRNIRTTEPIRYVTPETGLSLDTRPDQPFREQYAHLRNGRWVADNIGPLYSEPFPLADPATGHAGAGKYFLVNCNPDRVWNDPAAYGLYLIDVFGNRVRIYQDPQISCWQPIPLRPRALPPAVPAAPPSAASAREATVLLSDVYAGLDGVEAGAVKYLRIWEQVPRPWAARRFWPGDEALGQHAIISLNAHIHVKILHGIVPVRADGSACFVVPADKNLFFQALDADYMEVQRMRTFVNFQPGETRGCIGCHQPRTAAPPPHDPLAWRDPPVRPGPQPGETVPRPLYFPTDVQPILDRHCVRCHGAERTDGGLDLSGAPTQFFSRSYETIMRKPLVACIQEFIGPDRHAQTTNVEPLPPRALGARASRLMTVLLAGHYDVRLTLEDRVRLATWIDANAPYYGSYFGRRNLIYKDHPDFRPKPTVESASGQPPPEPAARGGEGAPGRS